MIDGLLRVAASPFHRISVVSFLALHQRCVSDCPLSQMNEITVASVVEAAEGEKEWDLFEYSQRVAMRFANNLLAGMKFADEDEEKVGSCNALLQSYTLADRSVLIRHKPLALRIHTIFRHLMPCEENSMHCVFPFPIHLRPCAESSMRTSTASSLLIPRCRSFLMAFQVYESMPGVNHNGTFFHHTSTFTFFPRWTHSHVSSPSDCNGCPLMLSFHHS